MSLPDHHPRLTKRPFSTGELLADGIVHTLDMGIAAQAVEAGAWQPEALPFAAMPAGFGYVLRPTP